MNKLKSADKSMFILPLVIILMMVIVQSQNPNFLSPQNISNVMRQISAIAVISFGMTFVIISGNIDLSMGSIIGFSSVLGGSIMVETGSVPLGIAVALGVGLLCGLVNGILVALTGLHPFIVTLGTLTIFYGFAFLYTGGNLIAGLPPEFLIINTGALWVFPYAIIIAAVVFIILRFVLYKTKFGLYLYIIGGRHEAAESAGLPVKACKIAAYGIMGLLSGLAGMMLTARIITGQSDLGMGYHLIAIGCTVIGGTSLRGGRGTLGGTVLGVLIVGIMANGLNLLRVGSFWQDVATGLIIIIALLLDTYRLRNKKQEV